MASRTDTKAGVGIQKNKTTRMREVRTVTLDRPVREFTTEDEKYCSCVFFTNAGRPPRDVAAMKRKALRFRRSFNVVKACKYSVFKNSNFPVSFRCIYTEDFLKSLSPLTLMYFIIKKKVKVSEETKNMIVKEIIDYFGRVQEFIEKMRAEKSEYKSEED